MEHNDHVNLLRPADIKPGGSWADLGAGAGAFTFALRELSGPTANIFAVDKDRASLNELQKGYRARFGDTQNLYLKAEDFTHKFDLPALDGIVMANSLHFFKDKQKVLTHIHSLLKSGGILLIVEYNVDTGNPWVPYPFSFETYCKLISRTGFSPPRLLGTTPSRFLKEFYSARVFKNQ
jgi:ubiquinone/menaquinone biosynthesis C-methylase UbiE